MKESFELITFADESTLAAAAAGRWLDELAARNPNQPYSVALSGGRIARTFFSEVTRQGLSRNISWGGVHFFWADERCVPPTDPENNFRVANELLFEPLKIPAGQIHRLRGEADESLALADAVAHIIGVAPLNERGQPILDLIFLGMGEEGHVASLFPGEPEELVASPAVYRLVSVPKPPPRRITVGYGVLAAAKEVWMLASGQGKEAALRESLKPAGGTPFGRVLRMREQTRIFTDIVPGS